MKAFLSDHGKKRSHQRAGLGGAAAQKQATRALEQGLPRMKLTGDFRKWADGRVLQRPEKDVEMHVYGQHVFVFGGRVLITTYPVPEVYRATALAQWQRWKARKQ
jgi:hypothetical protein